ncbi:MAG TPA: O-antigen ligase family protein [Stellaceae bacterium]|nr:O-antigen ligase family protein [Stellaceae bacterium]
MSRRGIVLALCGALAPLASFLDPLAMAPLFTLAAVATLALEARALRSALRALAPFAALGAALGVWATLSALWSIIPLHSFLEGLRLLLVFAGGSVLLAAALSLAPRERRLVATWTAVGLALATLFGLHEALTDASISRMILNRPMVLLARFDRAATVLALALWPVVAASRGRWRVSLPALFALGVAANLWLLFSTAALLAIFAALVVFAVAWFLPRATAAALGAVLVLFAAAAPFAVPPYRDTIALYHDAPQIKWSALHRLMIWRFTADRVEERPLLGWGMDASRAIPGGEQRWADRFPGANLPLDATTLPLHPHNAVLQWELELGIPGTLLALAIVLWGLWRAGFSADLARTARAGALAWAAAALVIACLSYGVWQAWWLSSLFLTAALLSVAAGETPRENGDIRARDRP